MPTLSKRWELLIIVMMVGRRVVVHVGKEKKTKKKEPPTLVDILRIRDMLIIFFPTFGKMGARAFLLLLLFFT